MKKSLGMVAILGLLSVVTYCSSNYFGRAWTRNSANNPASVTRDCATNLDCTVTNGFPNQPETPGTYWPEIIFVGDTSPSMKNNYESLADSLSGWLDNISASGIENFCVGYMPSHAGEYTGLYYAPSGYPKCMCSSDYSNNEIATKMKYILEHAPEGDYTDSSHTEKAFSQSGETGLYSIHNALSEAKILKNQQAGCMRAEYTLAFIPIADENDIMTGLDGQYSASCVGVTQKGVDMGTIEFDNSEFPELGDNNTFGKDNKNSSKYNPVDGTNCQETQGRFLYYSDPTPDPISGKYKLAITPKSVHDEIVNANGVLPSFGSGIAYFPGDQPNSSSYKGFQSQDGPGWGIIEGSGFASQFGQDVANLKYSVEGNQSKFNDEMNKIGDALVEQLSFIYVFDLSDPVCETKLDSLVVRVNGAAISSDDYVLSADRDRVTVDQTYDWNYGDSVTVEFKTCS